MINFILYPFLYPLYLFHFFLFEVGDFLEDYTGCFTPAIQGLLFSAIPCIIIIIGATMQSILVIVFGLFVFAGLMYTIHMIVDNSISLDMLKRNNKIVWRKILRKNYYEFKIREFGGSFISKEMDLKMFESPRMNKWERK